MAASLSQAQRELAKLQAAVERRGITGRAEVTDLRPSGGSRFNSGLAAHGKLSGSKLAFARKMHFNMYGTPEIDAEKWGPKEYRPTVTLDLGKPNQVAPAAPARPSWFNDPRVVWLDDKGKVSRPIGVDYCS